MSAAGPQVVPGFAGADDVLRIERPTDHVVHLTLNRPDKRNALSPQLRHALLDTLTRADSDPSAHVAIISGAGPCFSAGYDIKIGVTDPVLDADPDGTVPNWATVATRSWLQLMDLDLPILAQVHGLALAGGVELLAACDLVYVSTDARIGHPVVPLFGPPDFNFSPWLVGPRHSMEMMLTGELMSAAEAVRIGLVNRTSDPDDLAADVLAVATRIAASPRAVSRANKRTVRAGMDAMGVRQTITDMIEHRVRANELTAAAGGGSAVLGSVKDAVAGQIVGEINGEIAGEINPDDQS